MISPKSCQKGGSNWRIFFLLRFKDRVIYLLKQWLLEQSFINRVSFLNHSFLNRALFVNPYNILADHPS
jgi:hypothetical protein